ncbi:MAG: exo-alpha-sialidase [Candidatus Hydrogenedentes bacterium]|nr:exo-alpha-sialidase [Candidatus Hydrogenedentota bacterium]
MLLTALLLASAVLANPGPKHIDNLDISNKYSYTPVRESKIPSVLSSTSLVLAENTVPDSADTAPGRATSTEANSTASDNKAFCSGTSRRLGTIKFGYGGAYYSYDSYYRKANGSSISAQSSTYIVGIGGQGTLDVGLDTSQCTGGPFTHERTDLNVSCDRGPVTKNGKNYYFKQWKSGASGTNPVINKTFTGNNPAQVALEAEYAPKYTITLNVSPSGRGHVSLNNSVPSATVKDTLWEGTVCSLEAVPTFGNVFSHWSGTFAVPNSGILTLDREMTLTANFVPAYKLEISRNFSGSGNGKVQVNGVLKNLPFSESYISGADVKLVAVPDPRNVFKSWSGANTSTAASITVKMSGAKSLSARFERLYELEIVALPATGNNLVKVNTEAAVKPPFSRDFVSGTVVALTAVPDTANAWYFKRWLPYLTGDPNTNVNMSGDKTITAEFGRKPLLKIRGAGSVAVNGTVRTLPYEARFQAQTAMNLDVVALAGFDFQAWSGWNSTAINPLKFNMPETDVTLDVKRVEACDDAPIKIGNIRIESCFTALANGTFNTRGPIRMASDNASSLISSSGMFNINKVAQSAISSDAILSVGPTQLNTTGNVTVSGSANTIGLTGLTDVAGLRFDFLKARISETFVQTEGGNLNMSNVFPRIHSLGDLELQFNARGWEFAFAINAPPFPLAPGITVKKLVLGRSSSGNSLTGSAVVAFGHPQLGRSKIELGIDPVTIENGELQRFRTSAAWTGLNVPILLEPPVTMNSGSFDIDLENLSRDTSSVSLSASGSFSVGVPAINSPLGAIVPIAMNGAAKVRMAESLEFDGETRLIKIGNFFPGFKRSSSKVTISKGVGLVITESSPGRFAPFTNGDLTIRVGVRGDFGATYISTYTPAEVLIPFLQSVPAKKTQMTFYADKGFVGKYERGIISFRFTYLPGKGITDWGFINPIRSNKWGLSKSQLRQMAGDKALMEKALTHRVSEGTAVIVVELKYTDGYTQFDLIAPDGTRYSPGMPEASDQYIFLEDPDARVAHWVIGNPAPGDWRLDIPAQAGLGAISSEITELGSSPSLLFSTLDGSPYEVVDPGEPVPAVARDNRLALRCVVRGVTESTRLSLFYDDDNRDFDGTPIVQGLRVNEGLNVFDWDTSRLAPGKYFVFARLDSEEGAPLSQYLQTYVNSTTPTIQDTPVLIPSTVDPEVPVTPVQGNWKARHIDAPWTDVAMSADGSKLAAVAPGHPIYTSGDFGRTWAAGGLELYWTSIASSADGTRLVAMTYGEIYTSSDSGRTWEPKIQSDFAGFNSLASSSDGMRLSIAGSYYGSIFHDVSTDYGATWANELLIYPLFDEFREWNSIDCSADGGTVVIADTYLGPLVVKRNGASTWPVEPDFGGCNVVAISDDGVRMAAVERYRSLLHVSKDSGITWTAIQAPAVLNWQALALSGDGTTMVLVAYGGGVYISKDFGATWQEENAPTTAWSSVAMSADGRRAIASTSGGKLYTYEATDAPPGSKATTETPATPKTIANLAVRVKSREVEGAVLKAAWQDTQADDVSYRVYWQERADGVAQSDWNVAAVSGFEREWTVPYGVACRVFVAAVDILGKELSHSDPVDVAAVADATGNKPPRISRPIPNGRVTRFVPQWSTDFQVHDADNDPPDPLTVRLLDQLDGLTLYKVPDTTGAYRLSWAPTQFEAGTRTVTIRAEDGREGKDEVVVSLETASDLLEGDSDSDGVGNVAETYLQLDSGEVDSDHDGIADGDELLRWGTDPLLPDSDGDGSPDAAEIEGDEETLLALVSSAAPGVTQAAPTGISPVTGGFGGGGTAVITGEHLAQVENVIFGSQAGTITLRSDTKLEVTVPPGVGEVDVWVTNPLGCNCDPYTHVLKYTYVESEPEAECLILQLTKGTATTPQTCTGGYASGATVSIVADAPAQGLVFDRWTGDTGMIANVTKPSTTIVMDGAKTIVATYKPANPADTDGNRNISDVEISLFVDGFLRGTNPQATDVTVSIAADIFLRGGCYSISGATWIPGNCN